MDLPSNIREAGQKASEAAGVANDYKAGEYSVADILQKKLTEAYGFNRDIIEKLDASTQNYFSAPSEARTKYQDIFNPFQRESLVSKYVGNQALPMLSQANVLGARMGGLSDLVNSSVGGYQAESQRAQGKAGLAQQSYQDLLGEYQLQRQLQSQAESDKLAREKFEWDKTHPSGGSSAIDLSWIADLFNPKNETSNLLTEPKPTALSETQRRRTNVTWRSPKGQWMWDYLTGDWAPIID